MSSEFVRHSRQQALRRLPPWIRDKIPQPNPETMSPRQLVDYTATMPANELIEMVMPLTASRRPEWSRLEEKWEESRVASRLRAEGISEEVKPTSAELRAQADRDAAQAEKRELREAADEAAHRQAQEDHAALVARVYATQQQRDAEAVVRGKWNAIEYVKRFGS